MLDGTGNHGGPVMRPTPWLLAEPHRITMPGHQSRYGDSYGAFRIPCALKGVRVWLNVLAQDGRNSREDLGDAWAWDHVSVSTERRTPTWGEMDFIKDIFWLPGEAVVQFHVPKSEHINCHPFTLHLWKCLLTDFPRPPSSAV